jgi:hypothetical protein
MHYEVTSTNSQVFTQTFEVTVSTYNDLIVYSKDSVTFTSIEWDSTPFPLDAGSSVYMTMNLDDCACAVQVLQLLPKTIGESINFTLNGTPTGLHNPGFTGTYDLTVHASGSYEVAVDQLQVLFGQPIKSITLSGITIVQRTSTTQATVSTSYKTNYNTVTSTAYTSSQAAPYSAIGFLPSIMIFILVGAIGVVATILIDQRRKETGHM